MIAFIGVRISWLMLARNIDFSCVASSALSLRGRELLGLLLELPGLLLGLAEELLRPDVAGEDLEAHPDDRQQLVEQRLLVLRRAGETTRTRGRREARPASVTGQAVAWAGAASPTPDTMRRASAGGKPARPTGLRSRAHCPASPSPMRSALRSARPPARSPRARRSDCRSAVEEIEGRHAAAEDGDEAVEEARTRTRRASWRPAARRSIRAAAS